MRWLGLILLLTVRAAATSGQRVTERKRPFLQLNFYDIRLMIYIHNPDTIGVGNAGFQMG